MIEQEHSEIPGSRGRVNVAFGRGDDRPFHQDMPLTGERIGVLHAGFGRQLAQVTADVRQVQDTGVADRTVPGGHLEQRGNEGTTFEIRLCEPFAEDLEDGQQALSWSVAPPLRFRPHPAMRPESLATLEEGKDEVVLRRKVAVQRHLRDARFTDHCVHPDSAGALAAEQVIRRTHHPLAATFGIRRVDDDNAATLGIRRVVNDDNSLVSGFLGFRKHNYQPWSGQLTECTRPQACGRPAGGGTRVTADQTSRQVIKVRSAVAADLPAVHRLVRAAYAEFEPWLTPSNWVRMTGNIAKVVEPGAAGRLRVGRLGHQLAGTVTYLPPGPKDYPHVPPEWAVIRVLAVDPALRGRGVARALTEDCLAMARADHAPAVGLHTAEMMVAARALYEGAGFARHREFTHLDLRFCIYMLQI